MTEYDRLDPDEIRKSALALLESGKPLEVVEQLLKHVRQHDECDQRLVESYHRQLRQCEAEYEELLVERNRYAWALVEVKRAVRDVNSKSTDLGQLSEAVVAVRRHTRDLRLGAFG